MVDVWFSDAGAWSVVVFAPSEGWRDGPSSERHLLHPSRPKCSGTQRVPLVSRPRKAPKGPTVCLPIVPVWLSFCRFPWFVRVRAVSGCIGTTEASTLGVQYKPLSLSCSPHPVEYGPSGPKGPSWGTLYKLIRDAQIAAWAPPRL